MAQVQARLLLVAALGLAACDRGVTKDTVVPDDDTDPGEVTLVPKVDPRVAEAEADIGEGRAEKALATMDEAIAGAGEPSKEQAAFHFVRGNALSHLDRDEDALAAYRRALELHPGHHLSHAAVGNLLAYGPKPDLEGAVASLQKAIEFAPEFAPAHHTLGAVLYDLDRIPEAIEALARAHELAPETETKFILSQAYAKAGQLDEALRLVAAAVEAEPEASGVDLRILHARLLLEKGDTEAAVNELQRAGDLVPDAPALQIQVVRALIKAERIDLAEARIAPLVKRMPDEPAVRINYGDVLARRGKIDGKDGALAQYDAVIAKKDPQLFAAHIHKIEVLARAERCPAAEKAMKAFEKTQPAPDLLERGRRGLSVCEK